ncbi:MAG: WbqC family protein [Bacteroidota bacterium]
MKVLLPLTYLGSIDYYAAWAQSTEVIIEKWESFPKQTLRNRCKIYGANGPLELTIPIVHTEKKLVTSVHSDESSPWRNRHWQALVSAYRSSPFFEYFEAELEPFYQSSGSNLFDELRELTETLVRMSGLHNNIHFTNTFVKDYGEDVLDLRNHFKPSKHPQLFHQEAYHQVFADKFGFHPNLSVLDLLSNEGRNTASYLKSVPVQ